MRRNGTENELLTPEEQERFWEKVDMDFTPGACWPWLASLDEDGYGQFIIGDRVWRAHRVSYTLTKGEIPEGHVIRHRCDNRPCVRPDHLETGTQAENVRDAMERSAFQRGENNGNAKLTRDEVLAIYYLAHEGRLKQTEIAERFGITVRQVRYIKSGKRWGHTTLEGVSEQ